MDEDEELSFSSDIGDGAGVGPDPPQAPGHVFGCGPLPMELLFLLL